MTKHAGTFWEEMVHLLATHELIIDRIKGKPHPNHPEMIYPLDYGYLANTSSSDGGGIDVWIGSLAAKGLTGILCTFDTLKRDAEIKLLVDCDANDLDLIHKFYGNEMKLLFIPLETA